MTSKGLMKTCLQVLFDGARKTEKAIQNLLSALLASLNEYENKAVVVPYRNLVPCLHYEY